MATEKPTRAGVLAVGQTLVKISAGMFCKRLKPLKL
jgi:hypothetical protein